MVFSQVSKLAFVEIAVGICFSLVVFRSAQLGKGFYLLNTLLAAVSAACALLFEWFSEQPQKFLVTAELSVLLSFLILAAIFEAMNSRRFHLFLAAALVAGWAVFYAEIPFLAPYVFKNRCWEGALRMVALAGGSMLLGGSLVLMNLGHWYLVAKGLPFDLFETRAKGFVGFVLGRMLFFSVTLLLFYFPSRAGRAALSSLVAADEYLIFFLMRILWGLIGPLVLGLLALRCIQIRSNTSATGLMYVVVVCVLMGELLASYLLVLTTVPV